MELRLPLKIVPGSTTMVSTTNLDPLRILILRALSTFIDAKSGSEQRIILAEQLLDQPAPYRSELDPTETALQISIDTHLTNDLVLIMLLYNCNYLGNDVRVHCFPRESFHCSDVILVEEDPTNLLSSVLSTSSCFNDSEISKKDGLCSGS
mmetsp:Transcript_3729/g.7005  ORF Transcript_3729/g.7005 Transcript_3729/m.7005 type:complete len:151 (-) Transcript_3729:1352-1804(-)